MSETIFLRPNIKKIILPFIGGLIYALGFPSKHFVQIPFAPIFGFILLLINLDVHYVPNRKTRTTFRGQISSWFFFSLGACTLGYYWLPYTLKEFGALNPPVNYIIGSLFSLIIMPQYLAFILILVFVRKMKIKSLFFVNNTVKRTIVYALLLTILENIIPQQFPAHIGHYWLALSPYMGLAKVFGAPAFSFFSYWLALSVVARFTAGKFILPGILFFFFFLIANIFNPLENWKLRKHTDILRVKIVQPNIGNFMKVSSEKGSVNALQDVLTRYRELSTKGLKDADLIVWPETAYPSVLSSELMSTNKDFTPTLINDVLKITNAELFTGGYDRARHFAKRFFESEYNTAFLFGKNGRLKEKYHKMKLIPFGEGLPFGIFNELLSNYITNISYFASGENYTLFETAKNAKFFSAICYEILFSGFIRDFLNKLKTNPHFIINLTNDSWYGDTSEPLQHQFLAHWRAIEYNIPIIRSTNTGITSILFPDGTKSDQLGVGKVDSIDLSLKVVPRKKTRFEIYGLRNLLLLVLGIYMAIILWERLFRRNKPFLN